MLLEGGGGLQILEALSHLGLAFELFQIGVQLPQNVFHTGEVFAGVTQAVFSFASTLFVFGDASGLFQKQTQLFRLGLNDAADGALPNDGVSPWAQTGAKKNILHITTTHGLVVDVIAAGAVACQHPLDCNFSKLVPLPACTVGCVVKHKFHTGAARGFAAGGAIENDVLHGLTTQFTGTTLTQHPANGIDDVGFTAAIGADNAHQLAWQ